MAAPAAVVLDVLETLFPLEPLRDRVQRAGLPAPMLETWFTRVLRDGFALTAAGGARPFPEVAGGALAALLDQHGLPPDDGRVDEVLGGFALLDAAPDVSGALQRLGDAGVVVATLSNGTAESTQRLLERADLDGLVGAVLSVDDAGAWKPAAAAYRYACEQVGSPPEDVAVVAAHDWDVHGASRAGLRTAFVQRTLPASPAFGAADVNGDDLVQVVERLLAP